ncbi:MAG: Multidrug efflux system MdtABC-TolC, membrane fusion component MdtA [Rhodanobacteraceae bacterium]|jgi:multidrug efflux system membrane fusion protein|nr:MAG: Multidrug efflux system MdtABC-TolC, membrane fusion component MdtA [Rhodanobacteraceae bacterium]
MSRTKWILTIVGVVIVALILWRIFSGPGKSNGFDAGGADEAVPVTVVPATPQNVPVYLTSQGTVQALNTVNVQPQVGGQLLKLDFTEGGPVKKGQVLAEIDPRTLQAQLDQAIAKRAQDQTQLATARANYERSEDPKYKQYVAQIDRITQKNTVSQYQAAVAADNASIQDTQVQLGFTRITSPIDGLAGIRQVDPGNVITTSTTIVTVTQTQPIYVLFTLAGKYLDEVRAAQARAPLTVSILDAGNNVVEGDGKLLVIGNQIDPSTGSFQLKAEFPNGNNQLFPGQYANTRLEVGVDSDALVVPAAAVQRGPNGDYVWLVTDKRPANAAPEGSAPAANGKQRRGKRAPSSAPADNKPPKYVTMQPVVTGGEAGDTGIIVTHGLKAGDLVVTAGQFRLKQGSKITPMKPGEVPAPPTTAEIKAAAQSSGSGNGRGRRH